MHRFACQSFDAIRRLSCTASHGLPSGLQCCAGFVNTPDLLSLVRALRPTTLIGAASRGGAFNRPVIEAMSQSVQRAAAARGMDPRTAAPVVFALSNPTSKAECTFEQAYEWTGGRVMFASGTAFPPITVRHTHPDPAFPSTTARHTHPQGNTPRGMSIK